MKEETKHPIPALLSLIVPGLGQYVKGGNIVGLIGTVILTGIGYFCLVIPGWLYHMHLIKDAYNK